MSRRVDYLNYLLLGEGNVKDLPQPLSAEDVALYEACVNGGGVKVGAGAEGFYRCKVHNTGNGPIDFIGGFLDLGEERVSTVKVKAVVTVKSEKVNALGLRLFANNDKNKEMLSGGYSSNAQFDNLAKLNDGNLPVGGQYTLQAIFNDVDPKALSNARYLKSFISITKTAKEDICTLDVHEFTIEINDKIYNIIDSVFNFQEGPSSSFKYIQEEIPSYSLDRKSSKYFGKEIACLGDSITNGMTPTGQSAAIANPWRIQLREIGFLNVRNYGANGRMLSKDKDAEVKSLVNLVDDVTAFPVKDLDAVTVLIGINDLAQGVPVGEFKDVKLETGYGVDTFYGALQTLFERLIGRVGTEKPIAIINMLNGGNEGAKAGAEKLGLSIEEALEAYREAIRVCAKHYGLPVLELQDVVGFDLLKAEDNTAYSGDLLHPNQEGHNKIADAVSNFLLTL